MGKTQSTPNNPCCAAAPVAITTRSQAISPTVVCTPETRPLEKSTAVTAQPLTTRPPPAVSLANMAKDTLSACPAPSKGVNIPSSGISFSCGSRTLISFLFKNLAGYPRSLKLTKCFLRSGPLASHQSVPCHLTQSIKSI